LVRLRHRYDLDVHAVQDRAMSSPLSEVVALASRLIALDARSSRSNRVLADMIVSELPEFAVERLDFTDPEGVENTALVALRSGAGGCLAFSAHMDTVPPVGWARDPFRRGWHGLVHQANDPVLIPAGLRHRARHPEHLGRAAP
jgi:hypothetical protein